MFKEKDKKLNKNNICFTYGYHKQIFIKQKNICCNNYYCWVSGILDLRNSV